ncbi:hypothetical protein D3C85_1135950 [compost metagenome]
MLKVLVAFAPLQQLGLVGFETDHGKGSFVHITQARRVNDHVTGVEDVHHRFVFQYPFGSHFLGAHYHSESRFTRFVVVVHGSFQLRGHTVVVGMWIGLAQFIRLLESI